MHIGIFKRCGTVAAVSVFEAYTSFVECRDNINKIGILLYYIIKKLYIKLFLLIDIIYYYLKI